MNRACGRLAPFDMAEAGFGGEVDARLHGMARDRQSPKIITRCRDARFQGNVWCRRPSSWRLDRSYSEATAVYGLTAIPQMSGTHDVMHTLSDYP